MRLWWPHNEAMIAFAMLYARTREEHKVEASASRVKGVGDGMSGLGSNFHFRDSISESKL